MEEEGITREERVVPDYIKGLNADQVAMRIEQGQTNRAVAPSSKSIREIVIDNVCTYFNLIFAVIAGMLIAVGSFRDLTFLPVIVANTLIGIFQQISSKKTLDKLTVLNTPHAQVIRDGEEMTLPVEELVLDDIVIFAAGNQICADAAVISGEVQVNESLITGEADEIRRMKGDKLLSGSFIVSGKCYARLEQVGENSYAAKLTLEAKAQKKGEQSEMMRSLNVIVKSVGIIIIPISVILFYQHYFLLKMTFKESVISAVAAVIGMIPEGLYLLTSVALAVGVRHLASRKVLVHDMKCMETLARVDVLCVDKTGTITENTMAVDRMILLKDGEEKAVREQMGDFVANMTDDNATMRALSSYFAEDRHHEKAAQIISFSSATKYSGAVLGGSAYVLGAPEFVLREAYSSYEEQISSFSAQGFRVLVFARYEGKLDGKALRAAVHPLALILLTNPIRREARRTFEYFGRQDVAIKVISGDNPVTVSKVALAAGIKSADRYVDASKLQTEEEMSRAVATYTVFGRVTPNQKRQFVRCLKAAGHTVAMTGDGVNDVLALKDADCSIAMASGSDVACQAAQLVLLESNFACMPAVVKEGRRVVNNIERSASLFLVKNLFSLMMSLFAIIFLVNYPLKPSQVSLISMFTIGTPAFLLALEDNTSRISGRFMSNVLYKALPAGLTDFFIVSSLIMFSFIFGVDPTDVSTASVMLMAVVGFMILYRISVPMNRWRLTIFLSMIAGILFCGVFMSELFAITDISLKCSLLLAVFAIASEPIFRYLTQLLDGLRRLRIVIQEKRVAYARKKMKKKED